MSFPRTTSALRAELEAAGLRPRKQHGQCFLTDAQAVDAIVRDAHVAPGDHVVEVGTGPGLLTHALCEAGASIETFDVDASLVAFAQSLREWPESVRFHHQDVMADKRTLHPLFREALVRPALLGGTRRFVSNLPYNIATPLLLGVLALEDPPASITVMIQLEVAEKMLAAPGSAKYGSPSMMMNALATGRIVRRFPSTIFWPRPRVTSALLELTPGRTAAVTEAQAPAFAAFVTALFTRRRKILPTALAHAVADWTPADARAAMASMGLAPELRAQELDGPTAFALWSAAQ